jgi:BirA family transcriptional regulator, biotin operon repressor / biotin---[acetyl-CoA-carboxylase] ligase
MDAQADRILGSLYDAGEDGLDAGDLPEASLRVLRQRSVELESAGAGRLRLARPIKLDPYLIERGLDTARVGRSVICFASVASTNDVAWDSALQSNSDGLVVAAESQTAGRGRHGRSWVSPPRRNLLFSVLLRDSDCRLGDEAVTILAGLAVAEGIDAACRVDCDLKWPNDVLAGDTKVAGVLVETRSVRGCRCRVVGIGLNVGAAPSAEEIGRPATCLADLAGGHVDRIRVMRAVLRRLDYWVGKVSAGATEALRREWLGRCAMLSVRIRVRSGETEYIGRVLDIDPMEGLVLERDRGARVLIPAQGATILD